MQSNIAPHGKDVPVTESMQPSIELAPTSTPKPLDSMRQSGSKQSVLDGRNTASERTEGALPGEKDVSQHLANSKVSEVHSFPSPGCFSYLTFSWMDSLIKLAFTKNKVGDNLDPTDLWELRSDMHSAAVHSKFDLLWKEELLREKPSVKRALWRLSKPFVVTAFFIEWIRLIGSFASPLILREMIIFVQDPEIDDSRGYGLAGGMLIGAIFVALGKSHSFYKALSAGLVVKAATNSAVFHKALKLSNSARQSSTTGEVVNLMSTDAERMFMSFFSVNTIWSAPLQLAISLFLIHREVKSATWAGFGALFVVFILLLFVFIRIARLEGVRMKTTDERVKLLNEMLQGIKVIKLMVWEEPILNAVDKFRARELSIIRSIAYTKVCMIALVLGSTLIAALATFGAYQGLFPELGMDPVNVFTTMALLGMLKFPMMQIPSAISAWSQAMVSCNRMQDLLLQEERQPMQSTNIEDVAEGGVVLSITGATFSWGSPPKEKEDTEGKGKKKGKDGKGKDGKGKNDEGNKKDEHAGATGEVVLVSKEESAAATAAAELSIKEKENEKKITLDDITLDIRKGELIMIIGKVGSGKSSLLSAFLGDIEQLSGEVTRAGTTAYVSQSPWIRNATLRDNITFSERYDEEKFAETLRVCALDKDLEVLPAGMDTEIGERGINLSGGQKARVQLGRAVYRGADVYLLDDPLSAVDTHVARRLMDACIMGKLSSKTRVLVTHQLQFLGAADRIVVMEHGKVAGFGTLEQLISLGFDLSSMAGGHGEDEKEGGGGEEENEQENDQGGKGEEVGAGKLARTESAEERELKASKGMVKDEERDKGAVSAEVYARYMRAFGRPHHLAVVVLLFLMVIFVSEGTDMWLAIWSMSFSPEFSKNIPSTLREYEIADWLGFYAGWTLCVVVFTLLRGVYFQTRAVEASRLLVHRLVARVLQGRMSFFDTTPSGRILNRFSRDTDMLDVQLANLLENYLSIGGWLMGMLIIICILLPWFCLPFVPIVIAYKLTERYVTPAARELQRLDAVSRSPMVSHFSETLQGLSVIRSFRMDETFCRRALEYLDQNLRPQMLGMEVRRWLDLRLELVNLLVQFFTAFFLVISRDHISPAMAGLALTKALGVGSVLSFMVMLKTQLETSMNAVERITYYSEDVPVEEEVVAEAQETVAASWPEQGGITVENYGMRYRENLPLVLHDVNLSISPGERVGIVGRTGSGKSSFLVSLFRLVEAAHGCIKIDGVNIAALPLSVLRSGLSIIPQDPVLFSGTLRFNLDPFDQHSEEQVRQVLEWVQLEDMTGDMMVSEGGENISQGQRQLIALARVLLKQPKVLMLDEATASVDTKTDDVIQRTIRTRILEQNKATMLVIAHRLNTIIDSDRVLVMDKGDVAEFDSPKALLSNASSHFSSMVDRMGETAAKTLRLQCGATL